MSSSPSLKCSLLRQSLPLLFLVRVFSSSLDSCSPDSVDPVGSVGPVGQVD